MKKLFPLLILLLTVSCSKETIESDPYAACRPQITELDNSKAVNGLIEFDIIPDKNSNSKGAVLTSTKRLWKDATMPYYIEGNRLYAGGGVILGFEKEEDKNKIRAVIKELEAQTGLKIPEYDSREALLKDHKDGILITPGFASNSAHKGRQGGIQSVKITFGLVPGHIKHEFLHTAGFGHEFTRTDRDEYITIHFENMNENYHRQFEIDPLTVDCGEFDMNSIMMYGSFEIPNDEGLPIMTTVDGETFEMNNDLSTGDIATVKAMYNLN